jgi:acetyl-CoA carboxylase biotin carboxylase subunit
MVKKLLIANRGEIVNRIISTCEKMGIQTVAVYSEADRDMPYLDRADQTVWIGPANPVQSYLNIEALMAAAAQTGADSVHPGYGFLSERGAFAEAVEKAGLTWVGPSSKVLRAISSKCYCRSLAQGVDVPVIPGTLRPVAKAEEIAAYGRENGWPVFLKLDKGGGGKGIERVEGEAMAGEVFQRAGRIGEMAFGSGACYIEAVVDRPRHIEVQFLADRQGRCICLGERECSIQRRHQKIVEEAPSVVVTPAERKRLYDHTRRIVQKMGYVGAGTIENLRDRKGHYYFMEINARLQVEHPVTEFLTGMDIVQWQLRIADGQPLDVRQDDVRLNGHAIEARIYAEDPVTFMPSPGQITALVLPEAQADVRIDHALKDGGRVPPYYDPLLAKVIAWGQNRDQAVSRLRQALEQMRIEGVRNTTSTGLRILAQPRFIQGDIDTAFFDGWITTA